MSDIDDAQIKAEIDGIMEGVKTIMQKINAIMPEEEQEQVEDTGKNFNSSDKNEKGAI
ncbi:MAG: hypothetical protein P8185_04740 [Deltaproteobacteria bacterium]|jgi:hypothetical protein